MAFDWFIVSFFVTAIFFHACVWCTYHGRRLRYLDSFVCFEIVTLTMWYDHYQPNWLLLFHVHIHNLSNVFYICLLESFVHFMMIRFFYVVKNWRPDFTSKTIIRLWAHQQALRAIIKLCLRVCLQSELTVTLNLVATSLLPVVYSQVSANPVSKGSNTKWSMRTPC